VFDQTPRSPAAPIALLLTTTVCAPFSFPFVSKLKVQIDYPIERPIKLLATNLEYIKYNIDVFAFNFVIYLFRFTLFDSFDNLWVDLSRLGSGRMRLGLGLELGMGLGHNVLNH